VCPSPYRRTARIYARLGDGAASVRYNTLMVLTHLILNDMVKVKGQVTYRTERPTFSRCVRSSSPLPHPALPVSSRLRASCRVHHIVSITSCLSCLSCVS